MDDDSRGTARFMRLFRAFASGFRTVERSPFQTFAARLLPGLATLSGRSSVVYDSNRPCGGRPKTAQPTRHCRQCTSATGLRSISLVTQSTNRWPLTCSV
jgi:hypothetical protein